MTEENYKYHTSPFLLRNQFAGLGKWKIPVVPKFEAEADDFTDLRLISFDKISLENSNHLERMVHFFLYDYKFERVWKNPDTDLEKLKRYRAVLTPDFSMYTEMAPAIQLYNTFRNRWCGAYYASKGIRVIPTVSWGDENTFEFCFDGIEKGSAVAVSTYMVSAHGNRSDQKAFSLKGYNEMLQKIEPEKIICYNEPFPEMQGDIVFVDYDLNSWRHMNDDPSVPSKYARYICGVEPLPSNSGILIKGGHILDDKIYVKGMGSAYGGKWVPSKADDGRFLGEPGDIINSTAGKGYERDTWIGEEGRAFVERHYTDHNQPRAHSDPHDHFIIWDPDRGNPILSGATNYPHGDFPTNFSYHFLKGENVSMRRVRRDYQFDPEEYRFKTISEFKWCMHDGGEVAFNWNGKDYGIFPKVKPTPESEPMILIGEDNKEETDMWYATPDDVLEHLIDGTRLREIITQVEVTDRTI